MAVDQPVSLAERQRGILTLAPRLQCAFGYFSAVFGEGK
jgi:hypothetical protein